MASIVTLLGDGSGGFKAGTPTCAWPAASTNGAALEDFDGDGHLDVATWAGNWAPGVGITVAFGDGSGGFSAVSAVSLDLVVSEAAFVAGDFNSDGKADLAGFVADAAYPNELVDLIVLMSEGRTFGSPQRLRTSTMSQYATTGPQVQMNFGLASGDFNGDGIPDALVLSPDLSGTWTMQAVLMNVLQ
jgi:hypothetical protein